MDEVGYLPIDQRGADLLFQVISQRDFKTILYQELYCPLREIIHLFGADPEEGLQGELFDTHQSRFFSSKEFEAGCLLLGQKLVQ